MDEADGTARRRGDRARGQQRRPVTSYEVARLAGVSQPTVSRALRGDRIAEATRQRVLLAAEALGYVPSDAGRSLSTRVTKRVGVVLSDLSNTFYLAVLEAVERHLDAAGCRVTLFRHGNDEQTLAQLAAGAVDGVILTSVALGSSLPRDLHRRRVPTVLLNRETADFVTDVCVSNNVRGAGLVAAKFHELGHQRIGAILGPANINTGRDRAEGFRAGLAACGLVLRPEYCREVQYRHAAGHDALLSIMNEQHPPTAIFCGNDVLAIGALNAAEGMGISIPADLTVIGYDDVSMAAWERFSLTTVRQGIEQMSQIATELLLSRIADPDLPPRRSVVEPDLVERATHSAPA
jgi:LacI family transcriptional regulator